jgi:hypothetical protein
MKSELYKVVNADTNLIVFSGSKALAWKKVKEFKKAGGSYFVGVSSPSKTIGQKWG